MKCNKTQKSVTEGTRLMIKLIEIYHSSFAIFLTSIIILVTINENDSRTFLYCLTIAFFTLHNIVHSR